VKRIAEAVVAGSLVLLAACGQSEQQPEADKARGGVPGAPPKTEFDLASKCFALLADGKPVLRDGEGFTTVSGTPEHFFMHATGLGRYAFFTADSKFMTGAVGPGGTPAVDSSVAATVEPSDGASPALPGVHTVPRSAGARWASTRPARWQWRMRPRC
jgi:hypothetical protein